MANAAGQHRRDAVVVGDDDVDAAGVALGHLGHARRPAVHRDDQRRAGGDRGVEGRHRQAVPLVEPARHVGLDRDAVAAQGQGHDRETGQAVGIEVAEDQDPFAAIAGGTQPDEHDGRVRKPGRIMQTVERIGEPGDQVLAGHRPAGSEQTSQPGRDATCRGDRDGRFRR